MPIAPRPRFLPSLFAVIIAGFSAATLPNSAGAATRHAAAETAHATPKKKKKVAHKTKPVHRSTPADAPSSKLSPSKRRTKRIKPKHNPHPAQQHAAHAPRLLARCGFTPASRKQLFSHAVYVVDENTHTPLYARNADTVAPIASVSKLMTAIVWLDSAHAPLQRRLEVTTADLDTLKFTHSRLDVGSSLTRANMLHVALMSSENRAAAALSRDYPGGRPAFVAAMNAKALRLGMTHTHFVNGTGLSPQNVSTARELASLVRAANGYPLIRRYSIDHEERVPIGYGQLQYVNSNRLVRYGQVQASVQKTGFINESGHNMVMRMMVHGRRPVIVTMLGSATPEGSRLDGVRIAHWLSCSLP
jgi:serine-type D-Ala-D-Ala endopeptidase (penicillin-binding protein 7)